MTNTIMLSADSKSIVYLCKKDKRLAKVINTIGPITYTIHDDGYAFLVHEIIEQMLSIKAGAKIYKRLEDLCEGNITPQNINMLSDEQIKSIGTSNSKVSFIRSLTNSVISKQIQLNELTSLSDIEVLKTLTALRGIGNWTAKMYLIFVLDRQDILPYEDVAFLQAFEWLYKTQDRTKDNVEKSAENGVPTVLLQQDTYTEHWIPDSQKKNFICINNRRK